MMLQRKGAHFPFPMCSGDLVCKASSDDHFMPPIFMAKLVCSVAYTIVFISITSFFQIATTFVMLCTFVHNFL